MDTVLQQPGIQENDTSQDPMYIGYGEWKSWGGIRCMVHDSARGGNEWCGIVWCEYGWVRVRAWAYWFLFPKAFFKVNVPPKSEVFGIFCDEDGMRTFPSIELIGAADW